MQNLTTINIAPDGVSPIFPNNVAYISGAGVPTAATGAGWAGIGSNYTDITNANAYVNGGTMAVPVWKLFTRAA